MLKYKRQIDILEEYCGEFAEQFEWWPPAAGEDIPLFIVKGKINRFRVEVFLEECHEDCLVGFRFYPNKTGGSFIKLLTVTLKDPHGPKKVEERIRTLTQALSPSLEG